MLSDSGDIVVLIPGITGSVLERNGHEIWGTSAAAVLRGLFSGGQSVQDLLLTKDDDPSADDLGDGVRATRLVHDVHLFPGLWSIDGYTKIAKRLCLRLRLEPQITYFEFPYDWRRDNRAAARNLQKQTVAWLARRRQTYPTAKLILIAHSMGGLVARQFLEVLAGWHDTRALISFGTPYRGSVNAFQTLVNGIPKLGRLDLTSLAQSFTSVYQLLPIYPCFDPGDGTLVRLSETSAIPRLTQPQQNLIQNANQFHRDIEKAVAANQASVASGVTRYDIRPIVGIEQPTTQTAIKISDRLNPLRSRLGSDESGDGTVPRVSATPIEAGEGQATFAAARHGSLQNTDAVLAQVQGILTAPRDLNQVRAVGAIITLSLDIDSLFTSHEPIRFAVHPSAIAVPLEAMIEAADGSAPAQILKLPPSDDPWLTRQIAPLPAGVYRITVSGDPTEVEPLTDIFCVA